MISVSIFVATAHSEVAVRHPSVSENEFQALAQALGYTPITEYLTDSKTLSSEVQELFRNRLFDAQKEWLTLGPGSASAAASTATSRANSMAAVDQFLELRLSADWPAEERQTFVTFFIRKLQTEAPLETTLREFAEFIAHDDSFDLSDMNLETKVKWLAWRNNFEKTWIAFPSNLPSDVTNLIVNGRTVSRTESMLMTFSRGPMRVTFLSNAQQPVTVILKGTEAQWPSLNRKSFVQDDCTIARMPGVIAELKMKALGFAKCDENMKPRAASITRDLNQIESFGLAKGSSAPLELPEPPSSSFGRKPWLWGAVGAIVVGVVVASQLRERQSAPAAIQPANTEGW